MEILNGYIMYKSDLCWNITIDECGLPEGECPFSHIDDKEGCKKADKKANKKIIQNKADPEENLKVITEEEKEQEAITMILKKEVIVEVPK